jgi:thymidylate synthase (FAD)
LAELTRHRLCSFSVESTRFCNYNKEKFGKEISVIEPPELVGVNREHWINTVSLAETMYLAMIENGVSAQIARSVLPLCLKTEIWCMANLREWMHIFELRCASAAHPQMREVMLQAQRIFADKIPEMFANEAQG